MGILIFLIIVFIGSILLSFYFSAEGFNSTVAVMPNGFNEASYLQGNPDIAAMIHAGAFNGHGWEQWLQYGKTEGRCCTGLPKDASGNLIVTFGTPTPIDASGNTTHRTTTDNSGNLTYSAALDTSGNPLVPSTSLNSTPFQITTHVNPLDLQSGLIDANGNTIRTSGPGMTVDASGNLISNRLKDLISILTQTQLSVAPSPTKDISNNVQDIQDISNNTQSLSDYYTMLKPQIQKDISNAVHSEFERSTVLPNAQQASTISVQQGAAWPQGSCGGSQISQPDMSEYIRKDSIPCYACSGF